MVGQMKQERRLVLKKLAYITPVILTLAAMPSFASKGSGNHSRKENSGGWWSWLFG